MFGFNKEMLNAIEEGEKEALRTFLVGLMAIVTYLITTINITTGIITINWAIVGALTAVAILSSLLKGIEKYLYTMDSGNPVTKFLKFQS